MKFVFNGSTNDLISKISRKAIETNKDMRIETEGNNKVHIGFQRLGHSAGRWLVADILLDNEKIILQGNFSDIYLSASTNTMGEKILDWILTAIIILLFYIVLLIFPLVLWLFIFKTKLLFVPFLTAALVLIILWKRPKKADAERDHDFINFMINQVGCEFYLE